MMKKKKLTRRKIKFQISIGSYMMPYDPMMPVSPSNNPFPIGGKHMWKTVKFETNGADPFTDACYALQKKMGLQIYHIWYWTWIK